MHIGRHNARCAEQDAIPAVCECFDRVQCACACNCRQSRNASGPRDVNHVAVHSHRLVSNREASLGGGARTQKHRSAFFPVARKRDDQINAATGRGDAQRICREGAVWCRRRVRRDGCACQRPRIELLGPNTEIRPLGFEQERLDRGAGPRRGDVVRGAGDPGASGGDNQLVHLRHPRNRSHLRHRLHPRDHRDVGVGELIVVRVTSNIEARISPRRCRARGSRRARLLDSAVNADAT